MTDQLAEIREVWEHAKHRNEEGKYASLPDTVVDDTLLAFAEIERLRGLLARLERESLTCPVCAAVLHLGDQHGLDSDGQPCWLAKESGRLPAEATRPER